MKKQDLLHSIDAAASFAELQRMQILPEPYDDSGFYLIYYAQQDYRSALCDIVRYIDNDMRIFYDRYLETGETHVRDFVAKANDLHCRCVVFYISDHSFADDTFTRLCQVVVNNHIPYLSINLPVNGQVQSGSQLAKAAGVENEQIDRLFSDQVTYIPFDVPYADKQSELTRAYEQSAMHFSIHGDFAVADYVKDLAEEEISIPASVEIQGKAYPVKAVGAYAFSGCRQLKHVSFPDTVEDIGYGYSNASGVGVFNNCESLLEIVYPPHVKTLYGGMFNGCSSLERLILNDSLTFEGSPGGTHFNTQPSGGVDLANVNLDNTDILVGEVPLVCTLKELHLPDCAKIVIDDKEHAQMRFVYCSDSVWVSAYVGVEQFSGGSKVEIKKDHLVSNNAEPYYFSSNDIPERIVYPENWVFGEKWFNAFVDCPNLREVILPETVVCLENSFQNCPKLESVKLPESLQALCGTSFWDCPTLKEVRFPKYMYQIEQSCFKGCKVSTIVSDSIYSKRLFRKGMHIPFMILAEKKTAIRLYLLAIYVLTSIPDLIASKEIFPFYLWSDTSTIYINEQVKPFDIEGFAQVESDRPGYRKYDCTWHFTDRLKLKGKEAERANRHSK